MDGGRLRTLGIHIFSYDLSNATYIAFKWKFSNVLINCCDLNRTILENNIEKTFRDIGE